MSVTKKSSIFPSFVFLLVIGFWAIHNAKADTRTQAQLTSAASISQENTPGIRPDDHILGDRTASVVLIEYAGFEDPFSKQFHTTMHDIVKSYNGQVAWIYRHFPLSFHTNGQKEAEASECAFDQGGDEAFWKYTDVLFERTISNGTGFALSALTPLATELGLNGQQFQTCLDSNKFTNKVQKDIAAGMAHNVTGTPMTIITVDNEKTAYIPGALPLATVKSTIDAVIAGTPQPYSYNPPADPQPNLHPKIISLKLRADDHIVGSLHAPIVLVEYADFECPYCKDYHSVVRQIVDDYKGQVAWVYRNFPLAFHANAQKEAEAAECVADLGGNSKYWKFIDTLYERTTSNGTGFALNKLAPLAKEIGVDQTKFTTCLNSGKFSQKVKNDLVEGQSVNVTGTPSTMVLINGLAHNLLPGSFSYEDLKSAIDKTLAFAPKPTYDYGATATIEVNNKTMQKIVSGRILLKVEDYGRAYYINPKTNNGRFLGRADDAFQVMREEGVGITNADLQKIPLGLTNLVGTDTDNDGLPDAFEDAVGTDKTKPDTDNDGHTDREELLNGFSPLGSQSQNFNTVFVRGNKGVIFLQVEAKGEAWYVNPTDGKRYFLGRPEDAYQLMRTLSLGISNSDFNRLAN